MHPDSFGSFCARSRPLLPGTHLKLLFVRSQLLHEDISSEIIGAFYHVYNGLGYGFLESIYTRALHTQLRKRGLVVDREYPIPVVFEEEQPGFHRCDMIVNRTIILEIKATELLSDAPRKQLRNYLAALKLDLGMFLHFGPKANYYRILGPRNSN